MTRTNTRFRNLTMRKWLFVSALALTCVDGAGLARTTVKSNGFRDCPDCPEMVHLPAGSFTMGASLEVERKESAGERAMGLSMPLHEVTIAKPFSMGKYPVTVGEFRAFVEATGYKTGNSCYVQHEMELHSIYENVRGFSWRDPNFPQTDSYPVVCVSQEDAKAYAAWLSRKTGKTYTLPSEAQFEYAIRGGTTTTYFWADQRDATACLYSNQPDLDHADALGPKAERGPDYRFQCHDGYPFTSPVGIYRPNPFGLYDMQGNIWEATADCWNPNYNGAPTDGSAWMKGDCDAQPSRGASFGTSARAAYAGVRAPRDTDFRGASWGFRVARVD